MIIWSFDHVRAARTSQNYSFLCVTARAERKVEELKEQLQIAKLNFQHLGGELPEDGQRVKEQQEHQRYVAHLYEDFYLKPQNLVKP